MGISWKNKLIIEWKLAPVVQKTFPLILQNQTHHKSVLLYKPFKPTLSGNVGVLLFVSIHMVSVDVVGRLVHTRHRAQNHSSMVQALDIGIAVLVKIIYSPVSKQNQPTAITSCHFGMKCKCWLLLLKKHPISLDIIFLNLIASL